MKRRGFFRGLIGAGAAAAVTTLPASAKTEPVDQARPHEWTEAELEDLRQQLEDARHQATLDLIKQSPEYQAFIKAKVLEKLGIRELEQRLPPLIKDAETGEIRVLETPWFDGEFPQPYKTEPDMFIGGKPFMLGKP